VLARAAPAVASAWRRVSGIWIYSLSLLVLFAGVLPRLF
jgi:hypothetical protein